MTALEIATILSARAGRKLPETGEDFDAVGIPILGGCHRCGAMLAAYNAHPQHNGYWACEACSRAPIVTMREWDAIYGDEDEDEDEPYHPLCDHGDTETVDGQKHCIDCGMTWPDPRARFAANHTQPTKDEAHEPL
jgi:hypothetical protein